MTTPATMYDVAALAGVSHQTVSRVLNGRTGVAEQTRSRVLAAMFDLDYQVNPAAREMGRRTRSTSRRSEAMACPTCGAGRRRWRPMSASDEMGDE